MEEQVLCEHCNKPIISNPLVVRTVRGLRRHSTKIDETAQFFHQSAYECAYAKDVRELKLIGSQGLLAVRVG